MIRIGELGTASSGRAHDVGIDISSKPDIPCFVGTMNAQGEGSGCISDPYPLVSMVRAHIVVRFTSSNSGIDRISVEAELGELGQLLSRTLLIIHAEEKKEKEAIWERSTEHKDHRTMVIGPVYFCLIASGSLRSIT